MKKSDGFTLIELLVTLAIITLVLGMGIPATRTLVQDAQLSSLVSTYLNLFNSARCSALAAQRQITFCVLDSEGRCSGQWTENLTLFFDDDRDGVLTDPKDVIEHIRVPTPGRIAVTFHAFGNSRHVSLRGNGTYRRNGTFRFCPQDAKRGRAIVINVLGRARTEQIACPVR